MKQILVTILLCIPGFALSQQNEIKIEGPLPNFHQGPLRDTTLVGQYIRCIFQDSKGHYWFGPAGQSVARYDGETLKYFSREEFFGDNPRIRKDGWNSTFAITEDTAGNVWFGSEVGLIKYDGNTFKTYDDRHGLDNLIISRACLMVDDKGTLWVGTQEGAFIYEAKADTNNGKCFSKFRELPGFNVKAIIQDREGIMWFASENYGVFFWDGFRMENLAEFDGLGNNYAGGIAQDAAGNHWFTTTNGICKYDGKSFVDYTFDDGIGGTEMWGIIIESSGIIWITARGATTRFDPTQSGPGAFQVYSPNEGMNCCVQSMYEDRSGNMWWGTGQGLFRFDGQQFYQVKQQGPWD